MGHFIIICKKCNVTISQCRCMFANKDYKEGICLKCKDKVDDIEEPSKVYSYDKDEQ